MEGSLYKYEYKACVNTTEGLKLGGKGDWLSGKGGLRGEQTLGGKK